MTDERTEPDETVTATESRPSGTTARAIATPVEDEPSEVADDELDFGALPRRAIARIEPRLEPPWFGSDGTRNDSIETVLRVALTFGAVLLFAVLFGTAAAAIVDVLSPITNAVSPDVAVRLAATGVLVIPVTAFVFVASWEDATVTRPELPDGHPPIADAWLLVLGAFGGLVVAFPTAKWLMGVRILGIASAGVAAYVVLPFWLARRCLEAPSWTLGGLTYVAGPMVLLGGVFATESAQIALDRPVTAAFWIVVGTVGPFALAYASPGPRPIARRLREAMLAAYVAGRRALGRLSR